MSIAVIRNPRAGSAPPVEEIQRALADVGQTADIHDVPAGPLMRWLDDLAVRYHVLAAVGGDGTVSSVAEAAVRAGKILAIIPAGTLNHFARDAGIPLDFDAAIAVLARHRVAQVDVGVVNDRTFVNNVSIGSYPDMVQERTRLEQQGRPRRIASIVAIARTWWKLRRLTARLSVDRSEVVRRSPLLLVGNGVYVVSGLDLGRREELTHGKLSLYVTPGSGRFGLLTLPFRALLGTLDAYEQFEVFHAETIGMEVRSKRLRVAIDGEVIALQTPLRFQIRKKVLRVLVPAT